MPARDISTRGAAKAFPSENSIAFPRKNGHEENGNFRKSRKLQYRNHFRVNSRRSVARIHGCWGFICTNRSQSQVDIHTESPSGRFGSCLAGRLPVWHPVAHGGLTWRSVASSEPRQTGQPLRQTWRRGRRNRGAFWCPLMWCEPCLSPVARGRLLDAPAVPATTEVRPADRLEKQMGKEIRRGKAI